MDPSNQHHAHQARHHHPSQHRVHRSNGQYQQHQHDRLTQQHQQQHPHHHQQHQHTSSAQYQPRRPQHAYETPRIKVAPIIRQTPPSAQHYNGSIGSVSRQAQFRKQQQAYYSQALPKIGLDYVNNDDDNDNLRTPSPIVLDPAAPTHLPTQSSASKAEAKPGMMQHLLKGIVGVTPSSSSLQSPGRISQHHSHSSSQHSSPYTYNEAQSQRQSKHHQHPPQQIPAPPNATDLARLAPKAGFLQKLGTNIPTYKRRFFILQPSSHLYYFLSPNDTVPRGAIPMDDANVRHREDLPDGRSRLEISWPSSGRSVVLEARSREVADEWCQSLQTERICYVRAQWEESQQELAQAQCEIDDMKKQLEHYRYVEEDRDGALEDARRWKEQFEQLDEAIRLLANHIRKPPPTTESKNESENKGKKMEETGKQEEEKKEDGDTVSQKNDAVHHEDTAAKEATKVGSGKCSPQSTETGEEGTVDKTKKAAEPEALSDDNETETPSTKKVSANVEKAEGGRNDEPALDDADNGDKLSEADHDKNDVNTSRRDISLLDDDAAAEEAAAALFESSNIIEQLHAPGQHFPALINACQQVRENLRLTSEEAISAVEDTKAAQEVAKALQTRMTKAEKQLVDLWSENCQIRKTLKQKKREKRVLVREVKSLMEQQQQLLHQQQEQQLQQQTLQMGRHQQQQLRFGKTTFSSVGDVDDDASTNIGSDEERLINELEEHVVSSIRLHEEFISASSAVKEPEPGKQPKTPNSNEHLSSSSTATTTASTQSGVRNHRFVRQETTTSTDATAIVQHTSKKPPPTSPRRPLGAPLPSLFDRSSFESDSDDIENDNASELPAENDTSSLEPPRVVTSRGVVDENGFPAPVDMDGRSISSVAASFGGDSASSSVGRPSTPLRPNPILQLDQEEPAETPAEVVGAKCFKPISIAQRGEATSRLFCPWADVVHTKPKAIALAERGPVEVAKSHQEEFQVYHLTFYTRKIGLQFQKVPAPPTKPRGLLTDAMTSDLAGDPRGGNKTASELKRVAAISTWAKNDADHGDVDNDSCLQVATPVDAVLVCGFEGFDDSGNNARPKLGARLVAFDGVSVEVGKWTFDGIRKAIQARGRPLTLSFRNDFLTTDQRAIMTKSVSEAEKHIPPPEHPPLSYPVQHHGSVGQDRQHADDVPRPSSRSSAPSVNQVSSHETDQFVNETFRTSNIIKLHERGHPKRLDDDDDDLTVSTTGYYSDYHHHPEQFRRLTGSSGGSFASRGPSGYSNSYRSFSEAGSSASALSSAIGPLVTNLLGGLSSEKRKRVVNMNPSYLHSRIPVESTPQHQEFQAGLL